jgi:hypothetical protein
VPLSVVRLTDGFWHARLETTRRVTIPCRPDVLEGLRAVAGVGRESSGRRIRARRFVAVPDSGWANRGAGEMRVWIRHESQ